MRVSLIIFFFACIPILGRIRNTNRLSEFHCIISLHFIVNSVFHEFPMHVTVSFELKNTLIVRLHPVSFEINNLLLLLPLDDDEDDVATGAADGLVDGKFVDEVE